MVLFHLSTFMLLNVRTSYCNNSSYKLIWASVGWKSPWGWECPCLKLALLVSSVAHLHPQLTPGASWCTAQASCTQPPSPKADFEQESMWVHNMSQDRTSCRRLGKKVTSHSPPVSPGLKGQSVWRKVHSAFTLTILCDPEQVTPDLVAGWTR